MTTPASPAPKIPALAPYSNPFAVSHTDWVTIQVYVENTLHLPTTDDAMAKTLQTDVDKAKEDFSDLRAIYAVMADHGTTWKNHTYPFTVNLADDLVHYAAKADIYYGALNKYIPGLIAGDSDAKSVFVKIVESLLKDASAKHDSAKLASDQVSDFANDTDRDSANLSHEFEVLNEEYDFQKRLAELAEKIDNLNSRLRDMEAEYERDVIIAATTATYAWVPVFGWIAAPIVAGVYGSSAATVKEQMDATKGLIDSLEAERRTDAQLYAMLQLADKSMSEIQASLKKAQPVIARVKGIWSALASDLAYLQDTVVTQDIRDTEPVIAGLGIDTAIAQWKRIGEEADQYRVNAFVTIQVVGGDAAGPDGSQEAS